MWPMFVDYFSPFPPWCDSVIKDSSCLSTVGNNSFECAFVKNTILSETGDESATQSSDIPTLDSGYSSDHSMTWSAFVVSMDSDALIKYERMSSENGTAEDLVVVFKLKITVKLENGKVS